MNNEENRIVELSHGGGGKRMDQLIHFISEKIGLTNDKGDLVGPKDTDDSAVIDLGNYSSPIVLTTDSHTVDPVFFRGGNIGDLAVAGTVNDLVVMGAKPLYLTLGMIIEEGFPFSDLGKIAERIGELCRKTGVRVVAGDTKVMPKGMLSNIVLNTSGFGVLLRDAPLKDSNAKPGDIIIVTGSIGDHGSSLISLREGLQFETSLESDVMPLWPALKKIVKDPRVHAMKDMTRGGFASAANEIATKSNVCLEIEEEEIPIKPEAKAICEILGLEIMEVSCEGKVIIIADPSAEEDIMKELRSHSETKDAKVIGRVKEEPERKVLIKTSIGGTRILDKPFGEPIPRVC